MRSKFWELLWMVVFVDHTLDRGFGNEMLSNRKAIAVWRKLPSCSSRAKKGFRSTKIRERGSRAAGFVVVQSEGLLAFT
jgi:hypothetical protein